MRQIAVYGKGGIGKSTIVQNVAAALGEAGHSVMVVGCDPKADCTGLLTGQLFGSTVLEELRDHPSSASGSVDVSLDRIVQSGCFGVRCVEAGGPEPGVGCAGRGIITAINLLEREGAFTDDLEYVIYDVLGDVVCGGFAMPIREGKAREIYVVTSGEAMALYAANNIAKGIARFSRSGGARIGGIICNNRNVAAESDLVETFARELGSRVIATIPRDNIVQESEIEQQTVVEHAPESAQAQKYRDLASAIADNDLLSIPKPLTRDRLVEMSASLVRAYCR